MLDVVVDFLCPEFQVNHVYTVPLPIHASFTQNEASFCGGGLYIEDHSEPFSFQIAIFNTVFSENMVESTYGEGGGVDINFLRSTTNTASFTDSVFTGNVADEGGSKSKIGGQSTALSKTVKHYHLEVHYSWKYQVMERGN